jgi:uncharacterized protein (DUF58 family)
MENKERQGLPEKIREIEIRAKKAVNALFSGEYHSVFKGRGLMFAESRPYQPGDDVRAMDWKVTARSGHPHVKVFHEERELTLMLLVDMSGSGQFGSRSRFKSEAAAQLCASLAFSAIRNNDKVGLIAFTAGVELFIAPRKGRSHVLRLIREALCFKPSGKGTDIQSALEFMSRVINKKCIAFLVSDFFDEGYDKTMGAIARKHDLVAVRMFDRREMELPEAVGYVAMEDAETGERLALDTYNPKLRLEFLRKTHAEITKRSKTMAAAGVDEVVVDAGGSLIEPLVRFFKLRERRKRFG